jgi:signal transduction histidine kinase
MVEQNASDKSKREAAFLSWIEQFAFNGVITLDTAFRVESWNHWMEIHSGLRLADVAGKDLFTLFPSLRERNLFSAFERALHGESCVLSTALHHYLLPLASLSRENGDDQMLQTARLAPLRYEDTVCGILILIEDVTQRETQAEALRKQNRRDRILSWASAHLLKSDEPRKTVRQLFFKVAEHLDFDTFFLYLRDIETGILKLDTTGGVSMHLDRDFADYPLLRTVADSHERVVFNSVQQRQDPEFEVLKKAGVMAAVAIPLLANDRVLGLFCFATCSRDTINEDDAELLTTISQYLATAVDRENTSRLLQKAKEQLFDHAQLLEKKVEERTSRLQETISELETFSYTLAHDLKAPVRGITGYSYVLLEDFENAIPREAQLIVQKMLRTSKRMEVLIRDLLEFSKVSRQEAALSRVEIEPIIDSILGMRSAAVRRAVTVLAPLHAVQANSTLVQQVLTNLIDNAIKFVQAKAEPKITISTEVVAHSSPSTRSSPLLFNSIEPQTAEAGGMAGHKSTQQIRIWVKDEGIGIPVTAHQKIFGIFERGVAADVYEGTGMGLAIVARAVQRMHGSCGVESEPGKGSRFWIELPAD